MIASKGLVLVLALMVALVTTATALPVGHQVLGSIPQHRLRRVEQARSRRPASTSHSAYFSAVAPPLVYPTDFGADPTGKTDSTTAMLKALNATLALGSGRSLSNGIRDLGGATLDLGGGDYLISQPIAIPQNVGNLRVVRGTLRASPSFPSAGYLVTVGAADCGNSQHSCNENVGFENLMLDGSLVAAGCLQIGATMGAVVGPQMFFLGFNKAGITVVGGHETMVSDAWLGQFLYSDPRKENGQATTANGIELLGNDHYVTNTIVFSAKVGVLVKGAANLLVGVHTWNLATPNGGIGILVDAPGYTQNRVVASYMDYNSLVAVDPQLLTVQECFFLVGSSVVIQASPQSHSIQGLVIVDNEFHGGSNTTVILDESRAQFTTVTGVTVDRNIVSNGIHVRSTRATAKLSKQSATQWTFDFSQQLLFPTISRVQYSFEVAPGTTPPRHASLPPNGRSVTVVSDVPVTATVYIEVDQGGY